VSNGARQLVRRQERARYQAACQRAARARARALRWHRRSRGAAIAAIAGAVLLGLVVLAGVLALAGVWSVRLWLAIGVGAGVVGAGLERWTRRLRHAGAVR
jgi:protein-S-isoprenylcysteine O-methyltransferase Ste14